MHLYVPTFYRVTAIVSLCTDVSALDAARKASSSLSLANGSSLRTNGASGFQRKRLHAPTLAELGSSDSDVSVSKGKPLLKIYRMNDNLLIGVCSILQDESMGQKSASSSSISTPIVEDTSPESAVGKKSEFLTCIDRH